MKRCEGNDMGDKKVFKMLHDGHIFVLSVDDIVTNNSIYGHYYDGDIRYTIGRDSIYGCSIRRHLVKRFVTSNS